MGFGTPTGKFEMYSTIMEGWGYDPLPAHVEPPEKSGQHPRCLHGLPADPEHRRQAADVLAFARTPAQVTALAQRGANRRNAHEDGGEARHQERRLHLDRNQARQAADEGNSQ